jgi:hypothetical protein
MNMRRWRQILRFLVAVQLLPALESGEETLVGGQAVLEGVMMRSPHAWGIAVRKPSGEIVTHSEPLERPSEQHKWMGWPVVRGVMTLGHAMTLGFRALKFSANAALEDISGSDSADKDSNKDQSDSDKNQGKSKYGFLRRFLYLHVQVCAAAGYYGAEKSEPGFRATVPVQPGGWADPDHDVPAVCLGRFTVEGYSPRV